MNYTDERKNFVVTICSDIELKDVEWDTKNSLAWEWVVDHGIGNHKGCVSWILVCL